MFPEGVLQKYPLLIIPACIVMQSMCFLTFLFHTMVQTSYTQVAVSFALTDNRWAYTVVNPSTKTTKLVLSSYYNMMGFRGCNSYQSETDIRPMPQILITGSAQLSADNLS